MKKVVLIAAMISAVGGIWAGSASAASIPVSYVVGEKALKEAVAGTTVTFSLYSDPMCTTLVGSEPVLVEDVLLRESIKPFKVKDDTAKPAKLVEMRHVFSATPTAGSDLYVRATASVPSAIDTTVTALGECQAQQPAPPSGSGGFTSCVTRQEFGSGPPSVNLQITALCQPGETAIGGGGESFYPDCPLLGTVPMFTGEGWNASLGGFGVCTSGTAGRAWAICCP